MKSKIEEVLDQLLKEIKKGRSIEDCLKEYPEYIDELGPLLRLAKNIEELPKPKPNAETVEATIRKVRTMIPAQKQRFSFKRIFSLKPALIPAVAVVVLVFLISWTTVFLSARSLPGDFLYPVKRLCEKVQYVLTIGPEGKAKLNLVCADKRAKEFVLTFKEGEKIDRELLNDMLHEKQMALKYSESLSAECLKNIKQCNCHQIEILEEIKPLLYGSDTMIINEAINKCNECDSCVDSLLNLTSTNK